MASVRLTNDNREDIVKKLISQTFQKKISELSDEVESLLDEAYKKIFSDKERKIMESIPKGWLPESDRVSVIISNTEYFDFDVGGINSIRSIRNPNFETKTISVPSNIHCRYGRTKLSLLKSVESNKELAEKFVDLNDRIKDLDDEIMKARSIASTTVYKVNTLKQLLENWPEIEEAIPEYILEKSKQGITAVALPREDLNNMFGLPTEKKVANS